MTKNFRIKHIAYIKFLKDIVGAISPDERHDAVQKYRSEYISSSKADAPDMLSYLIANTSAKERYIPFDKFVETLYRDEDYIYALLGDERYQKRYLEDIEQS